MNIGLQTWGTKGDIFPFFALAEALAAKGHSVRLGYTSIENITFSSNYENLEITKVYDRFENVADLIPTAVKKRAYFSQVNYLIKNASDPAVPEMYAYSKFLCDWADVVIGHVFCHPLAVAAEKAGVRRVSVVLFPHTIQTNEVSVDGKDRGILFNSLSWYIANIFVKNIFFKKAVELREAEGLPSLKNISKEHIVSPELTLIPVSSAILTPYKDWKSNIKICGFLESQTSFNISPLSDELQIFLSMGSPPIFMGFGSMGDMTPLSTYKLLIETAKKLKIRAIIQTSLPLESLENNCSDIFFVNSVPHERVFSKCSLVVHHGGAGTTQAALKAGKPSVVVVHAFDQDYWAKVLEQTGVAGKPLKRRTVNSDSLTLAVNRTLSNPNHTKRANEFSQIMANENGLDVAVSEIEGRFDPMSRMQAIAHE